MATDEKPPHDSPAKAEPSNENAMPAFLQSYEGLLKLTDHTPAPKQQQVLNAFTNTYTNLFSFKEYEQMVTKSNNEKLFHQFTNTLARYSQNYDLQTSIFQSIRILTRSKTGINELMTDKFHKMMNNALKSQRRKLIVQCLAVMANLCYMNKEQVSMHAVKHKTYRAILDILLSQDDKFKNQDRIYFLGLNCLFYLVLDKTIGTQLYKDDTFFRWLFDLFLLKTQHFDDKRFWRRPSANTKTAQADEQKQPEYRMEDDCRIVVEILRILFNFTLVETNVLKFKLDKLEPDYQRQVVMRAVRLLSVPCEWETDFSLDCNAKLLRLSEVVGLISIKLKLCNVALYDGDILGMNMTVDSADAVCKLMEFFCLQTRHSYETQPQIGAMMMFLKAVCRYNGKVRAEIKRYIFKADADPTEADGDSDDDADDDAADDDENPATSRDEMMRPKHLDAVKDGEETIKNLLLKHCTSVNYSVKRTVAEFLFALCGDDQQEMIRLCGLGNAIGIFVDKGIPGFAGAADNATNLDDVTKLKGMQQQAKGKRKSKESNKGDGKDTGKEKGDGKSDKENESDKAQK